VADHVETSSEGIDQLVQQHISLVRRIAGHFNHKLADRVPLDDLIQVGLIGLLDAARHYRHDTGASFETYAGIRIRGAILDEMRKNNWAPRSVYRKSKMIADVARALGNQLGRNASDQEIAGGLNISISEYHRMLSDSYEHILYAPEFSLEREYAENRSGASGQVEKEAFQQALAENIKTLPSREQAILSLHYEEDMTLREIGEIMGISESRVSQIHTRAAHRLRVRLKDWV